MYFSLLTNYSTFVAFDEALTLLDQLKKTKIKIRKNRKHSGSIPNIGVSCEYCKISKNTYFEEHLRTTASDHRQNL